ncbi:Alpha carbonic anhydrase 4 [Porphyridium purpureum]|uniref:carbonic anhydrase n=1 Tax=Porphyridium purpureum TaxID=35688 RepID=A0A5J4YJJ5_PORPP|nr:Alpha carbonic anhydrase 4 [Porphyridium purpureum]|eukprot:POR3012..scf291_13
MVLAFGVGAPLGVRAQLQQLQQQQQQLGVERAGGERRGVAGGALKPHGGRAGAGVTKGTTYAGGAIWKIKIKICLDAPHQSPIDLRTDIWQSWTVSKNDVTAKLQTPRLKFAANPTFQGKRTRPGGPFSFPQVASDAEPAIRMLLPNGFVYKFLQFHFHTSSSEHALRGEKGIAEVHFVFGLDKEASADRPVWAGDNAPSNAVVGVLYRESPNPCQWTETVLKSLPNPNAPEAGGQPLKAGSLKDFVPTFEKAAYFNYMGSLTTPPCSEGILWFVFSRTAQMTMDQMARLQAVQGGANWRPLQLSGKERGSRYYMPVTEL